MATYVNDLRLKEIATGDESGTWGTSTNTNLELIGNAMGVGAEAIANASTHTITMADGVADEFRSTFLRLTGGGTACTVTLAPNTLSHTWIMRNETAAALTLTQGSGANVIIAAGQTKIVATDGGGAGAIVYEMDDLELAGNLLVGGTLGVTGVLTATSLDISGDIDIDGTANLDVIDVDGAANFAADVTFADGADIITASAGTSNTRVGVNAGNSIASGGNYNVVVGDEAGTALTTGDNNVAVGYAALDAEDTGTDSVAIGYNALTAQNNDAANYNVAVGSSAGVGVTTGTVNTLLGATAGDALETGTNNVIIGYGCDAHQSNGSNQIVIGHNIQAIDNSYFSFGKASNVVSNQFSVDASWSRSSDQRLKKDITDSTLGLSFINDLRTVKYSWKASHELDSTDAELAHLYKEDPEDNQMDTDVYMHNFIAQEVKEALDTAGVSDFGGWGVDQYNVQQVSREMFVIPLVKAVQELSAQVTALQAEVNTLKGG